MNIKNDIFQGITEEQFSKLEPRDIIADPTGTPLAAIKTEMLTPQGRALDEILRQEGVPGRFRAAALLKAGKSLIGINVSFFEHRVGLKGTAQKMFANFKQTANEKTGVGVQETLAEYFQSNTQADDSLAQKAKEINARLRAPRGGPPSGLGYSQNIKNNSFWGSKDCPMDEKFAIASAKQADRGSIVILRGVNPDSLGAHGVIEHPELYAPKPITCHAKSSYFGFTKGLVPADPAFSRYSYRDENSENYKNAVNDVKHATANGTRGTTLHLKTKIGTQDCFVYQGTFDSGGKQYRFQMAIPEESMWSVEKAVRDALRLGDARHLLLCEDNKLAYGDKWPDMKRGDDLRKIPQPDKLTLQKTEVVGIRGNPKLGEGVVGSKDRYFVSDYDVYAIAHTDKVPSIDPRSWLGENGGEVADTRDVTAIATINSQLIQGGSEISEDELNGGEQRQKGSYQELLETDTSQGPIQHAAAAALKMPGDYGQSKSVAKPDYPLWAIEKDRIIKITSDKELGAYLYCLQFPPLPATPNMGLSCVLNSKVAEALMQSII